MSNSQRLKSNFQAGQTIIETIIAVAMMSLGVGAAVSLASYSLHASAGITHQLVGTGLAREGVEALRNMRDTNWLKGVLSDPEYNPPGCYNYRTGDQSGSCYRDWQTAFYTLRAGTYVIDYDPASIGGSPYWILRAENSDFRLRYDPDGAATGRMYTAQTTGGLALSPFRRQIIIQEEYPSYAASPADLGPRLRIISQVWWENADCPPSNTFPEKGSCGVRLESYLTNWRNY